MTEKLYRQEALDARGTSLHGRVVLTHRLGSWAICFALCVILAVITLWLLSRDVDGTPLWRWIAAQF